ncbi:hypothetical protein MKW98_031106 [Papaver atlanticum]|uniref:Uncharacterized protein n=1 Tax=Papaver atlanticum TaxID=357466 RepID=A0AAD4SUV9_9MAGN|nr:hypothetical protein MKW98_031106 [Papaver atlanticum]
MGLMDFGVLGCELLMGMIEQLMVKAKEELRQVAEVTQLLAMVIEHLVTGCSLITELSGGVVIQSYSISSTEMWSCRLKIPDFCSVADPTYIYLHAIHVFNHWQLLSSRTSVHVHLKFFLRYSVTCYVLFLYFFKEQLQQHVRVHAMACWQLEQSLQSLIGEGTGATMSDDDDDQADSDTNLFDGSLDGADSMGFGPLIPTESERFLMERARQELKHEIKQYEAYLQHIYMHSGWIVFRVAGVNSLLLWMSSASPSINLASRCSACVLLAHHATVRV